MKEHAMASYEQIFFDPRGLPLSEAVVLLARQLGADVEQVHSGHAMTQRIPELARGAFLTGEVARYEYGDPPLTDSADREIFDEFPYYWSAITGPQRDGELAARAARRAFDLIASSGLGWPLVLTHDYDVLIATYSPETGVRAYPPGTYSTELDTDLRN